MTSPAANAGAFVITDLFNTGVDGSGVALGDNVLDPHYTLTAQPNNGTFLAETVFDDTFPIPPWVANNAGSRWIGPDSDNDANGPTGDYTYETTFTLLGNVNLGSVVISGLWGTDNIGLDILINGISTLQANVNQFGSLTVFSVTSGFIVGTNSLEFILNNAGGPTGLRVDQITGMYDLPEPTTLALFGLGLIGLGAMRRRRTA